MKKCLIFLFLLAISATGYAQSGTYVFSKDSMQGAFLEENADFNAVVVKDGVILGTKSIETDTDSDSKVSTSAVLISKGATITYLEDDKEMGSTSVSDDGKKMTVKVVDDDNPGMKYEMVWTVDNSEVYAKMSITADMKKNGSKYAVDGDDSFSIDCSNNKLTEDEKTTTLTRSENNGTITLLGVVKESYKSDEANAVEQQISLAVSASFKATDETIKLKLSLPKTKLELMN
ncbi:MAG: hypothetical protein WCQ53_08250 [bacterium]